MVGWQLADGWQTSVAQTTGAPTHAPAWHVSRVHRFPSSQAVPFGLFAYVQAPFAGLHTPACWQVLAGAAQVTGFAPTQAPARQVSVWVQASPSLQMVPSAAAGFEQTPVVRSHAPAAWH